MKFSKTYEPNQFEADIYALWESSNSFAPQTSQIPQVSAENVKNYTIVMPPPNANGNLHIGHGLTVALQDVLIRYHRLKNYNSWYIPGADHAGFETWVVYEKLLEQAGKSRFDFTRDELYEKVWDFVKDQRGNMELQLRALGASCDWSALTFTLDDKVITNVYATFKQMWDDGLIYRGEKLVNFCTKHQTAFADIEVTYKEEPASLWDIAYPLENPTNQVTEIIISTTRPETLLGDSAIAVNPQDIRYQSIIGQNVKLPLTNRLIPIIADEHADPEYGTGAVKITPAHDHDDYEVGERHHLPRISVIGPDGKMTDSAGANYAHLTIQEARKKVLKNLNEQQLLRAEHKIKHSVGHCYKCNTVIEPLLKDQWFIKVRPLADRAIQVLEQGTINFHPANKKKVLIDYLKNLKDWNISRQIPWGIPIPAFQNVNDPTDWIFNTDISQTQIEQDGQIYLRDEDTFDTWFSSGQWPFITTNYPSNFYPTSVMETGADLLFPWVGRMIMLGLYVTHDIPFKDVYMHGMVLDEQGQKMSKSKGNVINPMSVISEYGSDALRMGLIGSRSAGINQAFATSKVIASRNLCNKLWNIARFIQQMVDNTPETSQLSKTSNPTNTHISDDWICRELNHCSQQTSQLLDEYRFAEASDLLYDCIWNKYADWYLESQKLLKNIPLLQKTFENILIMLHPFAPFVTEAIWQTLSWTKDLLINQTWPHELATNLTMAANFQSLTDIISRVRQHFQSLPEAKNYPLLFRDDPLIDNHQMLIHFLAHAPAVTYSNDPTGLRITIPKHEIYINIPESILKKHQDKILKRIDAIKAELATLEKRLQNSNYTQKAPLELVEQTRSQLKERQDSLSHLEEELANL